MQPRRGVAPEPEPTLEERKPDARVAAATGVEGAEITLDASASKPGADDAAITSYGWDLDGDGVYTDADGVAPKTTLPRRGHLHGRRARHRRQRQVGDGDRRGEGHQRRPAITDARVDDGEPASFSAAISDPGTADALTAKVFWDGPTPARRCR